MHVVVLGAGGLGCAIGARLALAGTDVTLVARPQHVDAIARHGLQVAGIHGDHVVREPLRAVESAAEIEDPVDYLILLT